LLAVIVASLSSAALYARPYAEAEAGAGAVSGQKADSHGEGEKEHGLTPGPNDIFTIPLGPLGRFPVSNSMVVTWIVALGIIIFARIAIRRMKEVPDGAQNFLEWLVEGLYNFLESVLGPKVVKQTFWFFLTIFIFILFTNWFGLIPGVGTV